MRTDAKAMIITIIVMGIVCGVILGIAFGFTAEEKLNIDCDRMMYSDNWTLGYLRNISAYCSGGYDYIR
jgi:hypothetical protein